MTKSERRAPVATRAAIDHALVHRKFLSRSLGRCRTYYVHVTPDGKEWLLPAVKHDGRHALTVYLYRLGPRQFVEITDTRDLEYQSGGFASFTSVRPRGRGWEFLDGSADKHTTWWRIFMPGYQQWGR